MLIWPSAHGTQFDSEELSKMGLKVPAEQLLQICDPGVEENLPGTQAVQLALKGAPMEPSGQHAPAPALLYVNGAHARQTAEDVALLVALNVPDGHALHALVAVALK